MIRTFRNLLAAGACFAALALAQTGVVKSEGQPIPGATVKATQGDRILLTLTDNDGAFRFDGMTPGQWIVSVDMFGFDPGRKEVQVAATPTRFDFTLQLRSRTRVAGRGGANTDNPADATLDSLGNAASAEPPQAVTADASSSNESLLVTGSVSQGLQTTGADMRDFGPGGLNNGLGPGGPGLIAGQPQGLPGEPGASTGGGGRGGGFGGGGFGGRGGGGGFGGRGGRGPRDRNGNPAFIGNRRPNNNRINGSIFYTFGNSALDARPFAVNGIPEQKASFGQNRFGVSAGGPLFIPKLFNFSKVFWFVNYTGVRQRNGIDTALSEPTSAQRLGDFSGISNVIYDPTNNTPFPGQ